MKHGSGLSKVTQGGVGTVNTRVFFPRSCDTMANMLGDFAYEKS